MTFMVLRAVPACVDYSLGFITSNNVLTYIKKYCNIHLVGFATISISKSDSKPTESGSLTVFKKIQGEELHERIKKNADD